MQRSDSVLICKKCAASLIPGDTCWTCCNCNASYPSVPGLVRINPSPYYWGEISRDAMRATLERARQTSWRDAVIWAGRENKWMDAKRIVFSQGCCDWYPEVSIKRDMRALDIGSGWGNLAFLMSQRISEVYSLEGVIERADFQQIRREQEQIDNLIVVNSDLTILPFKHASFDLVVLNGVLEWMGLADLGRNPRDIQLSICKHIVKLLKPGGYLYIGIENRVSISAIRGAKDHSSLPFTSLLPQWLANLVVKLNARSRHRTEDLRFDSHRTYTYTPRGYRELLGESGFTNVHISWIHESNNVPAHSTRFESKSAFRFYTQNEGRVSVKRRIKSRVLNVIDQCGLIRYCMPNLAIVSCTTGKRSLTVIEEIIHNLNQRGYCVDIEQYLRYTGINRVMSVRAKIIYILFDERTGRPAFVAKLPRTRKSAEILREEENVFDLVASHSPKLNDTRCAIYQHINGLPVLCERFFPGTTFNEHMLSEQSYNKAIDWLVDFQAARPDDDAQTLSVVDSARTAVENVCAYDCVNQEVKDYLHRWFDSVSDIGSMRTRCVPVHGDFSASNILLSGNAIHITDWEWIREEGGPWEDFCALLMSTGFNTAPNGSNKQRVPENLLASLKGESVHSKYVGQASARFLSKTNLPPSLLIAGLLSAVSSRVIRDFDQHGFLGQESIHYRFLYSAARTRTPLWDHFAHLIDQGMTGICSDD